jgi:3-oxoacyl-[acyl-carrier-protein] synthase-1
MERIKWFNMNIVGTNIISPLGFTTDENFEHIKQGVSAIKHYDAGMFDMPKSFAAALIDREKVHAEFSKMSSRSDFTCLEKAAILSVHAANMQANIDLAGRRTIFILSTTKGNVDFLSNEYRVLSNEYRVSSIKYQDEESHAPHGLILDTNILDTKYLWHSAQQIARFFGSGNAPIVVSNACISGACAQIAAMRCLHSGRYDNAVVVGVDFLSKFIISGFQSLKALSADCCMPFDKNRHGLNLGEAAATIIFNAAATQQGIGLTNGSIRNDANHISAPSRSGEGSFRALKNILQYIDNEQIAFINAHGTATPYNDAMEAQAIQRAGLSHIPVYSLKACFGHTLGAAGIVESIISMQALQENMVLNSLNIKELDPECKINISTKKQHTDKKYFLKMLSGFGGCNAVLLFEKAKNEPIY